jgi:hypothetical protein
MFKAMLFLHLLTAVFAIGPLVHAVTTATRGLRRADASATASSARTARLYAYASVLVVIFGFGLMSATSPYTHKTVASFGETWIWLSVLLWLVGVAATLALVAPTLDRASETIGRGEPVGALTGLVAAGGGVVGLLMAVIVALMVFQPGG